MDSVRRLQKIENIALIAIFVLAITLPLFQQLFSSNQETEKVEARTLNPSPQLIWKRSSLKAFPKKFEAYVADHFGFRAALLRLGNVFKSQWLGISPSPDVVIGKDGWLYYSNEKKTLDSFRGARKLSAQELEGWRRALERRRSWLSERGAHYLLVLVPEKQTIYPEFVPARYNRIQSRTPFQQLVEYMAGHSQVDIIDLRESIHTAKANERVYFKTDSHWNAWGAFAGYQQIMGRLEDSFPALQPEARSAFTSVVRPFYVGDLSRITGLNTKEEFADLLPVNKKSTSHQPLAIEGLDVPEPSRPFATEVESEKALPRAVMLHDSCAGALMPLLSEHFARIVYVWRTLPDNANYANFEKAVAATVCAEGPQVFIEEMVERYVVIVPDEKVLFGGPVNGIPRP